MALVVVVALGVISVAIASPDTVRSAFAPNPVSTLPGGGTTTPSATRTASATSSTRTTTTRSATTTRTTTTTPSIAPLPTGEQALSGNPILAAGGMIKQVCSPPGRPTDAVTGQAFYGAALPCLMGAWGPLFNRARLAFNKPGVIVPTGTVITSPCGTSSTGTFAAFYCGGNETIYMPIEGQPDSWTEGRPLNYVSTFAHEFGHHVQGLNGTLEEAHRRMRNAGRQSPEGLQASRRQELQAQCFAGMFTESITDSGGSFTRSDIDNTRRFESMRDDSPTHGTAAHYVDWWGRGLANDPARCNTWSAPASDVN